MSETRAGLNVGTGEGDHLRSPLGGDITFIVRGEQSAGRLAVMEVVNGAGEGPPLHVHGREDETMYILEGEFRFKLGDSLGPAGPGSFVYIPKGMPHTWQITGDSPGRMLVSFAPAGMEGFFDELSAMTEFDLDSFTAAAARHSMEVVGPPLAESDPL
jgi:quercetin dioxygenase-like cupin family protein